MKKKKSLTSKYFIAIPVIIFISIIFELFVFNFRHFESLNYKEYDIYNSNYVINKEKNIIEFSGINKKINNLFIDIQSKKNEASRIKIYATDEANVNYLELPQKEIKNNFDQMKYIKINLSGKTNKLKIVSLDDGTKINSIKINVRKPLFISFTRIILLSVSLFILFLIRPKSELYKYKLINNKYSKYIILAYIIVQSIFFITLTYINPVFRDKSIYLENQHQYELLAKSLSNKKVNIDFKQSNTLDNMKNPYDYTERTELLKKNNEKDHLDFAYYNKNYYVYFGIVPCVVFYLPYHIITGNNMHNSIVITILLVLTTISLMKLLKLFVEKYFKNISIIHYLMISALFINTCGLTYIAKRPDFYSVPIISALFLSITGLYFWFSSIEDNNLNRKKVIIGSLFMALVAGCRPQFLIGSFFSIIIFKDYLFNNIRNKKELIKSIICFIIPYIIIALGIMYYNYIRFESPFDFGANYNLTGNDMTKRGFNFDRIFLGLYYYLLSTPIIKPIFPFAEYAIVETNYMGLTVFEPFFGGLLYKNIILFVGLISFKLKRIINNKILYSISIFANIFGIIIIIVDTQMAGILPRYITDFAWLFYLSTTIVIFSIINHFENKKNRITILNYLLLILFIYGIFYAFIEIPTDLSLTIKEYAPNTYYKLYNLLQFWI